MSPPSRETPISISLLTRAHSPTTASRIHTDKVLHRPLHLKPTTPAAGAGPSSLTAQARRRKTRLEKQSKRKKRAKPAPLSSRQRRALGLDVVSAASRRYELYVPLHELWVSYIQDLLGLKGTAGAGKRSVSVSEAAKLCSADFHGAEVLVVRSGCVGRVGLKGIVVKDCMHVFELICQREQNQKRVTRNGEGEKEREGGGDRIVVVPKEGTIFRFKIPLPSPDTDADADSKMDGIEGIENGERKPGADADTDVDGVTEAKEDSTKTKPPQPTPQHEEINKPKPKELTFELHGDQFIYRAADRANRKFKTHFLKNL